MIVVSRYVLEVINARNNSQVNMSEVIMAGKIMSKVKKVSDKKLPQKI